MTATAEPPVHEPRGADLAMLERLQREAFDYFRYEVDSGTGLIADKTDPDWPASIAATGLALAAYPVAVERQLLERDEAVDRTLRTLRFFRDAPQGRQQDATGYQGFYYHFLDRSTGRRKWQCELSSVDSALLLSGMLSAAAYFTGETEGEHEIRQLADKLYRRVNWEWMLTDRGTLSHGWKPESGFLEWSWEGYDEALLLYTLALGSPTRPIPPESYQAWVSGYQWREIYGHEHLYAGPLFIHQLSHASIDFRGIQDGYMRQRGIDYFENSRRATHVHREYAIRNPLEFEHYSENCWGISASDGPGPATLRVGGIERVFWDYLARGAPYGPDDGTIAPWSVVASLPFAPEIVLPALHYLAEEVELERTEKYGFKATFNPTFPHPEREHGWISPYHYGLNEGPIVLMIENFRSGLPWKLTKECSYVTDGLRRAGFTGGWL